MQVSGFKNYNMLIPFSKINEYIKLTGVLHIGGHWAEEAADYYANGATKTIWIEANPECMEKLKQETSKYPNAICIGGCVSDKEGEVIFNISNNEGQSSSILDLEHHKVAHPEVHYLSQKKMFTTTLNKLLKDYDLSEINMLNADIQGAELLMLKGATEFLDKFEALYLEVNQKELYKGCGLIEDIDEFLKGYYFERVCTEWCGNFGWGDALYVKKKGNMKYFSEMNDDRNDGWTKQHYQELYLQSIK
jgi:FkbM family methyltransferase